MAYCAQRWRHGVLYVCGYRRFGGTTASLFCSSAGRHRPKDQGPHSDCLKSRNLTQVGLQQSPFVSQRLQCSFFEQTFRLSGRGQNHFRPNGVSEGSVSRQTAAFSVTQCSFRLLGTARDVAFRHTQIQRGSSFVSVAMATVHALPAKSDAK